MKGHLDIICAPGHRGQSILRHQSFAAPLHLSKPHLDASGLLVVNVVNNTAGLFDGDVVTLGAEVETGAGLLLTAPSASRIYKARQMQPALVQQRCRVRAGAVLEYFPEVLIPQRGARYRQETVLEVDEGGQLFYFEWLAPGRVASGEVFAYERLEWHTDLFAAGRLAARERYILSPHDDSLEPLRTAGPHTHYLGCFVAGLSDFPAEAVESLHGDGVFAGWGPLCAPGCWVIKVLAADSLRARRSHQRLREILCLHAGRAPAALRRF